MTRVPSLMILILFAGDPASNADIFAFFDGEGKMKMLANVLMRTWDTQHGTCSALSSQVPPSHVPCLMIQWCCEGLRGTAVCVAHDGC